MKQSIIAVVAAALVISFILVLMNINARTERQTEVDVNLSSALEESMSSIAERTDLGDDFSRKLAASFIESLATGVKTDSTYIVNVLKSDPEKKMMTVEVIERYKNEQGKISTAASVKTIIYDRKEIIEERMVEMRFYLCEEDLEADIQQDTSSRAVANVIKVDGTPIRTPSSSTISSLLTGGRTIRKWKLMDGDGVEDELTPGGNATATGYFGENEVYMVISYVAEY